MSGFTNFLLGANLVATASNSRNTALLAQQVEMQNQQIAHNEHERRWSETISVWSRELESRGWAPIEADAEARRERARQEALQSLALESQNFDRVLAANEIGAMLRRKRDAYLAVGILGLLIGGMFLIGSLGSLGGQDTAANLVISLVVLAAAGLATWVGVLSYQAHKEYSQTRQLPENNWAAQWTKKTREKRLKLPKNRMQDAGSRCWHTLEDWGQSPFFDVAEYQERIATERLAIAAY